MKKDAIKQNLLLPVLHAQTVLAETSNQDQEPPAIAPDVQRFVIELIQSGSTNRQINKKLRAKKVLLPEEADLPNATLGQIRDLPECLLDSDLLSKEVRQVGHNTVGKFILGWAELGDAARARLLGEESTGEGAFGATFEKVTVGECHAIYANATKVLMETFAAGLADQLKEQREEVEETNTCIPQEAPVIPNLAEYLQKIAATALSRALREIDVKDSQRVTLSENTDTESN